MNKNLKLILFIISAVAVGFINGMFGGGGGMLCVPLLKMFLNLDDKKAHASAVLVMAIISIPTLIIYITTIPINWASAIFLTIGVVIGGIIGGALLKKMKNDVINIIFIIIMFVAGIKMIF